VYEYQKRAYNALVNASNNNPGLPYDPYARNILQEFRTKYDETYDRYKELVNDSLSCHDTAAANPARVPPGVWPSTPTAVVALEYQLSTLSGCKQTKYKPVTFLPYFCSNIIL
jgi:hypothetical protein